MDEDEGLSSEDELSDIAEGEEGEEAAARKAAASPVFGNEDGDAERAMDSLDQMSVDDLLRLKREFIKAASPLTLESDPACGQDRSQPRPNPQLSISPGRLIKMAQGSWTSTSFAKQ